MNCSRWSVLILFVLSSLCAIAGSSANRTTTAAQPSREDAYRANNIGVALLDQFKYKEGADSFRQALKLDPQLSIARLNLAIALYNQPDLDAALREAKAAAEVLPASPQAHYMLGLIARSQNRAPEALAEFQRVLEVDPKDPGANVNLGQLLGGQRKYPEAITAFRAAVAADPYNITAIYNLAQTLIRSGGREEGLQRLQQFQKLRDSGAGTTIGQNYQEQGRYANAVSSTGAEKDLVDTALPDIKFNDVTAQSLSSRVRTEGGPREAALGRQIKVADWNDQAKQNLASSLGNSIALIDFDLDGDLDLFDSGKLYRNDGGKFTDVTGPSGIGPALSGVTITGVVAGDYDNDGVPDLFVLGYPRSVLYHNDGGGKFSDATRNAGIPTYPYLTVSCAMVDFDHDGDLDIFIVGCADLGKPAAGKATLSFPDDFGPAPNLLLRNDGTGKFTDVTAQAKVVGKGGHGIAMVPTDFDNHRDVDLLVVNYNEAPNLFSNQRDGSFTDVAADVGLGAKGKFVCVAAGDVNKDDFTDFFFGSADGPGLLAISDGKGRFITSPSPAGSERANAAQFLDYDNDGLLDLLSISESGVRVARNIGGGSWQSVADLTTADLFKDAAPRALLAADVDGDGDTDVLTRLATGDLKFLRNDGGSRNRSLDVQLIGKVSNRSAAGSKVEARSGSLKGRFETYAVTPAVAPSDIVFGVGKRTAVDAVRVLWPSGILQAETEIPKTGPLKITEVDRKPSSCPFLYAWNGTRFEFITDFMGGGEMGYWESPGARNHPDPDEYVRIRGDQLKEHDGHLELRVTNELEEVLYVDYLKLIAVDHPAADEVYPNEGMTDPPRTFKLWVTRAAHPPAAAHDDHGNDVLERITRMDGQYPDNFALYGVRGYAEEHSLTLDLGPAAAGRTLLLLTGWTDYAFSSDNLAASQRGWSLRPPALQVRDSRGQWKTVIEDIGIPVGRPQTMVLDLTGKFPTQNREVRMVTNMRIYWDQVLVDTSNERIPPRLAALSPTSADLHWRGFSAEITPGGHRPVGYDYERVTTVSPWKVFPGRYTREGDVRSLLSKADDLFVISQPGDEISLSFDATRLPPLREGWKRTFLLYADGFSKEMDINSASPDAVLPLPFHGMKKYPYGADERYALTPERIRYVEHFNTRVVRSDLPAIETVLIPPSAGGKQR